MTRLARSPRALGLVSLLLVLAACEDRRVVSPKAADIVAADGLELASAQMPSVRISEFHYAGSSNERIEISGPAGTSLSGYSILLYGASNGRSYNALALTNVTIDASCGTRGVAVVTYAANGIQDTPGGIALINGSTVVDLLGYGATFVGTNNTAVDRSFVDIGVVEDGSTPSTQSLKRTANNVWTGPAASNFGTCNDIVPPTAPPVDHLVVTPGATAVQVGQTQVFTGTAYDASNNVIPESPVNWQSSAPTTAGIDANGLVTAFGQGDVVITGTTPNGKTATASLHIDAAGVSDIRITEVHYNSTLGDQQIEAEAPVDFNFGVFGIDPQDDPDNGWRGWYIALYDGESGKMYGTTPFQGLVGGDCDAGTRGLLVFPIGGVLQKGAPDGLAVIEPAGPGHAYEKVREFLSYRGNFTATDGPAQGKRSVNIGTETVFPQGSMQRTRDGSTWYGPIRNTFGLCNVDPIPPPSHQIDFSGRTVDDPNLPVGMEDQLFAVEVDQGTGQVIPTTITWNSETPLKAVIDARGVIHAYEAGTATFRATATDGSTATWSIGISNPAVSSTANWSGNLEFGTPIGPNDNANVVLTRDQFVTSVYQLRGIPNWVSAKLEASHFGNAEDRCDCYAYDESLPTNNQIRYSTADYPPGTPGSYERGKLLRSADLTVSDGDNKFAYLFSNVVPMTPALMNGAWASMEAYLGTLARTGKDVYMVAGASGTITTIGGGKITVPSNVWKAAIIMPHGKGLADVHGVADVQAVAAIMPNNGSVGSDWTVYSTTIDAVEALSGYNLFSLLEDQIELQVESNSRPPVAAHDGPYVGEEGAAVAMSAAASSDPDGDALTGYDWNFGDGSTASGASVSHTYAQKGVYTVTLTVTESHGIINTVTTTATIGNIVPVVSSIPGATLDPGSQYTASGSFTDPGNNSWTATVDYGDGSGVSALALSGKTFSLSHTYAATGNFTVTVSVNDGTATGTATAQVVVRARPVGRINGPFVATEGSSISMSAAASTDADGTIQSYAWDFGDGSTATGVSTSHTYPQDGTYTVTLTVTDNDGLSSSASTTATVSNVIPVVAAFGDATLILGDSYTASGSFTDPGADSWSATVNYGDGSSGPLTLNGKAFSLSHTYASLGTFTVTVTVSDGSASGTKSQTVRVRARPVASLNGPYTADEGSAVAMSAAASNDPDGTIQSYAWNFGDGTTGTGASVSHTYPQNGSYTVSLTVTDNDGLTGSASTTATIANVAPAISTIAGATQFVGETYSASGSFTDPGSDTWTATVNYGDNTGTANLPLSGKNFSLSHVYNTVGTFTVTVTVNDGAQSASRTASVVVRARPVAVMNGPYSANEGSTVSMSASNSSDADGTIQSYAWNFGDGSTGTGVSVSHVYANQGSFTVTLTVTDNDGFTGSASTTASIANVVPLIAPFPGSDKLETTDTYTADGSFTDPGADTWTATVDYGEGDGFVPLQLSGKTFSLSHQYQHAGRYTVTVRVSDGTSTGTQTASVNVHGRPLANITGAMTGPEGSALALSGSTSTDDGTIVSYAWNFGDGTTGTGVSPSHVYAQDGSYTVTLTVTDNEGYTGTKSAVTQISNVAPAIATLPNAAILQGEAYSAPGSFTDPGADNPWRATVSYGEGANSGLTLAAKSFSLTHTYMGSGTFTVVVQVTDDHVTSMRTATVNVMSISEALQYVLDQVDGKMLQNKIEQAIRQYLKDKKNPQPIISALQGFLKDLDKAVARGELRASDAEILRGLITRVMVSMTTVANTPVVTKQTIPTVKPTRKTGPGGSAPASATAPSSTVAPSILRIFLPFIKS